MIRGVVLDEIDFPRKIAAHGFFEIFDVGVGSEDPLEVVKKSGAVQCDDTEYLQGVSLPCGRNFRLSADAGPGLVEGGILSEAGFVFEEDRRFLALGFFLMSG